jgi:hypothetical protein
MKIHVSVEADNLTQMEVRGTEAGVKLREPFEGTWNAEGLLRLSASLRGVALVMLAKAGE